jgi:hypothetical protein
MARKPFAASSPRVAPLDLAILCAFHRQAVRRQLHPVRHRLGLKRRRGAAAARRRRGAAAARRRLLPPVVAAGVTGRRPPASRGRGGRVRVRRTVLQRERAAAQNGIATAQAAAAWIPWQCTRQRRRQQQRCPTLGGPRSSGRREGGGPRPPRPPCTRGPAHRKSWIGVHARLATPGGCACKRGDVGRAEGRCMQPWDH